MLQINKLSKSYNNKLAVDNISLNINKGEIFGFLGPNGAGKTTTIKMITGILRPTSGSIKVLGTDISEDAIAAKKKMAYVSDTPEANKKIKGIEYVNFMADMYDVGKERTSLIEEYAALFDMTENLGDYISTYSHGMQQKISLIGALITKPELLVLDEPMVGLDPKSSFNLKELMKKLCAEGKSVFFSTHVLDVAEKFCDRVGIINKGKLIAVGSMEELKQNTDSSLEEIFLELTNEQ